MNARIILSRCGNLLKLEQQLISKTSSTYTQELTQGAVLRAQHKVTSQSAKEHTLARHKLVLSRRQNSSGLFDYSIYFADKLNTNGALILSISE